MERVKLTLKGYANRIPTDRDEFERWASDMGFETYTDGNFSRAVSASGEITITVKDRYLILLDHSSFGCMFCLTEEEAVAAGLEVIDDE